MEDITLRHTVLKDFENRRVIIPNSVISNESIINSSIADEKICSWLEVGISYDSDIDLAISIIREEAMRHAEYIDNRSNEEKAAGSHPVIVRVLGYGESSVNLRAYIWASSPSAAFGLKCDLYKTVKKRF